MTNFTKSWTQRSEKGEKNLTKGEALPLAQSINANRGKKKGEREKMCGCFFGSCRKRGGGRKGGGNGKSLARLEAGRGGGEGTGRVGVSRPFSILRAQERKRGRKKGEEGGR